MKVSIRRKIILSFTVFILVGGVMWYLNYYRYHLLNQKLQIIERKEILLNTILEARRYEKNYFLYLDQRNLNDAVSYIVRAEKVLLGIINEFGRYTLAKDLRENLQDLRRYKHSLSILRDHHQEGISSLSPEYLMKDFPVRQKEVRELGKKITIGMEQMVKQERVYINRLIRESRIYHFIALAGIVTLSVFAVLFLFFNVNRPLKSIENAIHKIAQGDYENIPVITTGDEFESLVTSLNNMIDELNRRSEQLLQTEKMASLGTLTSGVAHELNNPLNNISTSVQILL